MTRSAAALLLLATALSGCAAIQRDEVSDQEQKLAAAGFTILPSSNPQRDQMLSRLPPNKISRLSEGERVTYMYPDPIVCHCLYAGGQQAYGRYQAISIQKRIADEQVTAAQLNWDWGPWGGYGGGFGGPWGWGY